MNFIGGTSQFWKGGFSIGLVPGEAPVEPPVDQPPVAGDDTVTAAFEGTVRIDALANDVDPEGGTFTLVGAVAESGAVSVQADGTLLYTAAAGFSGTDTIIYTIRDAGGNTTEGRVTVTVEPSADLPPVAREDAVTVLEGGTVTIDVVANDTDPEGGALTLVGAVAESGAVSVQADGTLLYTAAAGFSGTDSITYTVEDARGNTSQGRVTVTVTAPALSIHQADSTGDFTVDVATGEITLTVIEPAQFAGTYVVNTEDLALGPVNLAPPAIEGGTSVGDTLTAVPGLWAYDEAHGPIEFARLWYRGETIISGETEDTYVIQAEDVTEGLRHLRVAGQDVGTRAAEIVVLKSAPTEVPFAERGVKFEAGQLIREADLGPNGTDALFFASFVPQATSPEILMMPGGFGLNLTPEGNLRIRLNPGAGHILRKGRAITAGQRCHVLAAVRAGGDGTSHLRMWSRLAGETEWTEETSTVLNPAPTFVFASGRFFVGTNETLAGSSNATVFRIACWAGGSAPDISDPAVREAFVKPDGTLEDPATSQARYGAPRVDLHGSATDYAQGMNHGTAGNFDTVNGTFTDA